MKTKNLVIILILFLLIMLGSWTAIFLTREKEQAVINNSAEVTNLNSQPVAEKKLDKIEVQPVAETTGVAKPAESKPAVQPEKIAPSENGEEQAGQIQATMIINGTEYRTAVKPDSSVYDFMSVLKEQKKLDFQGKDYSGLGFFVEEINGVKNNPAGENWIYYVNNKPAQVGVSYYVIKTNDVIEWKFEKKSF